MIFYFDKKNKSNWSGIEFSLQNLIKTALGSGHSFQIEVGKLAKKKTHAQLRGFHRLIRILVPHFKEWTGQAWDDDSIKDLIKRRNGYTKRFKGVEITKSCKNASIEEMTGLIKEIEVFAAEMGIENCKLESREWRELEDYYQKNKK